MRVRSITPVLVRASSVFVLCLCVSCSSLTDIDASSAVDIGGLDNAEGANARYVGAVTLFAAAYNSGSTIFNTVIATGTITDELGDAGGGGNIREHDVRRLTFSGLLRSWSRVRVSALGAAEAMQQTLPTLRARIGHLFALAGYAEVFLGEFYCSGVSLANVVDGVPEYGEPRTTSQLFEHAIAQFDSAILYGSDDARVLSLARVGRGRALLNLGRMSEAAQAVTAVATSFSFATEHSSAVGPNGLNAAFIDGTITVSDGEGQNGLNFRTAGDPRVRTAFQRRGRDATTDVFSWTPSITGGPASATVLASGVEARLIEAEAALRANPNDASTTGSGWLGILNGLRSTAITPAMASLADPGSPQARVDQLFRERAFWLFLTAHRHGDLRRLIRQYNRGSDTVFPTGAYRAGVTYGSDVAVALPVGETTNNPKASGCLNLDP